VGGDVGAKVEEPRQPDPLLAAVVGDEHEVVGAGDDRAEGDGDDVDQRVDDLAPPRVGQGREVFLDASGARRGPDEGPRAATTRSSGRSPDHLGESLVTVMIDCPGSRNTSAVVADSSM
jgi:hypothetical protein